MKKQHLQCGKVVFVLTLSFILFSAGQAIAGSVTDAGNSHNFTYPNGGLFQGTNDQVCIYCHTPHNAAPKIDVNGTYVYLPLWNKTMFGNVATLSPAFEMYQSDSFIAKNSTYGNTGYPTGYTLMCMSCHDGISSMFAVRNNSGAGGSDIPLQPTTPGANMGSGEPYDPSRNPVIGRDLSNDHPVSFVYNMVLVNAEATANNDVPGLRDPASVSKALKLRGGRLECTTCHDPHDYGSPDREPFLRMSNAGSAMCIECHLK